MELSAAETQLNFSGYTAKVYGFSGNLTACESLKDVVLSSMGFPEVRNLIEPHLVVRLYMNCYIPWIKLDIIPVVPWSRFGHLEDQARKALESALGGKKNEFEKWNKEIKRREEVGGGGDAGGGGWFGWGRRFGWSNGDHFWQEAQQAILAVLGIIVMYLIVAKGDVMLAVIFNPLLYALRGTRNALATITSRILGKTTPDSHVDFDMSKKDGYSHISAKERVLKKWGSE
ncbi:hypothetical protein FH972_000100 [Carpinus fangiana]|uniref:Uncharacterized protein n=1 Tax=Carpinus fangiana TaxID=176857 RepID=A0A5N6Q7S7_9ROSI|nr:hypothetical protein FH972_000100 [Carpinus fangiana]